MANPRRHLMRGGGAALLGLLVALGPGASASGAAAPSVGDVWASSVLSTSARLNAEVDPNGKQSSYHFDYLTRASYDANVKAGKDPFVGTSRLPTLNDTLIAGTVPTTIGPNLFGLSPDTAYRYRLVVKNADGTTTGPTRDLRTFSSSSVFTLPDGRGWEMVSPVEKNGGEIERPGSLAGGGVLQAAADGQSVTYGSGASFAGGVGAAVSSQYIAARASAGWSTTNITPPLLSGSYGTEQSGVPYQLFSPGLARGLLLNGHPCRGEAVGCPVANPPLAGTDAPPGYQNYYLRSTQSGAYEALLGDADLAWTDLDPADFELSLAGTSSNIGAVVLSTCAALTANATEVPLGPGCDPAKANLYRWSGGTLTLINVLPAQSVGTPGATLGAQSAAVSAGGTRIYFNDTATGDLYLRAAGQTKQVDATAGGGGTFQTAADDGSIAYFTKAGHLWRYVVATDAATDITPGGGVVGVLGSSAGGDRVYFKDAAGLRLWHSGSTATIAGAVDASNYPPATGTARVSADGTRLLFLSSTSLETSDGVFHDHLHAATKAPTSQVYLYDGSSAESLTCVSCNPSFGRPLGSSSIPGAVANGTTPGSTQAYKPRALSSDGRYVFFDSTDSLVPSDVNLDVDVYRWEARGAGSCSRAGGCVALVSSGRANWARFVDASADGANAFFLTDRSLVGADPGLVDLYNARVGGGFPEPPSPSPCVGDACQVVPPAPEDPVLTTVLAGPGNPGERYRSYGTKAQRSCPKGKRLRVLRRKNGKVVKRKGKPVKRCVKVKPKAAKRAGRRGGRR